jgi:small multidrug resistance pump
VSDFSARVYRMAFAAAAAYNIAFGLWASLFPRAFFNLFELAAPRYPAIWACLGMIVGLYGVGYAYAAWRLDRAFPFIAIGLAGKILGPIGWVIAVRSGELPFRSFPLIAFDDLLWWLPFGLFLLEGTRIANFLKRTAPLWCVAAHIVAAAATLVILKTPLMWILWMIAAVSLIGFYAWWGARIGNIAAVVIAASGIVCDFSGESMFIAFPDHERMASLLTGGAANGLYTLAGILLTLWDGLKPVPTSLAWIAWSSGIALIVVTILNVQIGIVICSAALMISFIPFVIAMARP